MFFNEYIDFYAGLLKLNKESIYNVFYERVIYGELKKYTFKPILYLSYNGLDEIIDKLQRKQTKYLQASIRKGYNLCLNIKRFFPRDGHYLYIDPLKDTFFDLLFLLHIINE